MWGSGVQAERQCERERGKASRRERIRAKRRRNDEWVESGLIRRDSREVVVGVALLYMLEEA